MTKNEVRIRYKALRMALSKPEIEAGSMAIANRVLQLPVWEKSYFHVFLPIAALHEVDTELLLHILAGKDKHILVSRSDFANGSMRHFLLTDGTRLVKNRYGIPLS
jgi:5-formyltetrahydrofolate cyclo-ligase